MSGLIYDIQKYNTENGPGFRTVIFFKGCALKCKGCEKPYAQKLEKEMCFDKEKCKMCYKCTDACNSRLLNEEEDKSFKCSLCGKCVEACPNAAREIKGIDIEVDDLIEKILPEIPYYQGSNGGVTLAGGEPFLQARFVYELVRKLKQRKINIAIETTGHVDFKRIGPILDYVDLIIYNMKVVNPKLHQAYTGSNNATILNNLQRCIAINKKIIIKITLIQELNCNTKEIKDMIKIISKLKIDDVILKIYDEGCEKEYNILGLTRPKKFTSPNEDTINTIYKLFKKCCSNVEIVRNEK